GEGDFTKATAYYERILGVDRDNARVMYNLITINKYGPNARIVGELRRLYGSTDCTKQSRALVCFALARLHESHGDVRQAFRYYTEANALQFPLTGYDEAGYITVFREMQAAFTSELFSRMGKVGRTDVRPIFVLGMPRSGTSLVEQILASHSEV